MKNEKVLMSILAEYFFDISGEEMARKIAVDTRDEAIPVLSTCRANSAIQFSSKERTRNRRRKAAKANKYALRKQKVMNNSAYSRASQYSRKLELRAKRRNSKYAIEEGLRDYIDEIKDDIENNLLA